MKENSSWHGLRVLSLFDGMSCWMIALERAWIKVDTYYASEIDKYAIQVSEKNYPDIVRLWDVNNWREWNLWEIDLIIWWSPCQWFSFAWKQLAFDDPRSKLFFTMVDIINHHKPKYFLLENVKMKKEFQDVITEYMWVNPIEINSALVSAQNRKRLYWTNIPWIQQPKDKWLLLKDVLEDDTKEIMYSEPYYKRYNLETWCIWYVWNSPKQATRVYSVYGKSQCTTALWWWQWGKTGLYEIPNTNQSRKLTPLECERLQTVPDNYTSSVSNSQRYKMLWNWWTIDVISHILSQLTIKSEK